MAARRGSDEERPRLLVTHAQLETEIAERIELGQEILVRQPASWDELIRLERDFYTWDEYNERLLS